MHLEENYFSFIESTDLLENSSEELELNLFPNPIRQSQELVLNISFPASNEENISVTIVDVEGRTHFNHLMDTAAGDEQINVPMTGFQPGMYFCRIQSKAKVVVERFIVQ